MLLMSTLDEMNKFLIGYFKNLGYDLQPNPRAGATQRTNCYELKSLPIENNKMLCISEASVNKLVQAVLVWLENHDQQPQRRRQITNTEEFTAYLEIEFGTKIRRVHQEEVEMQGQLWGAIDKMATMLEKMS